MTEQEWIEGEDAGAMWDQVRERARQRKTRLVETNFWRWRAKSLGDGGRQLLEAVELAEQWAEEGKRPSAATHSIYRHLAPLNYFPKRSLAGLVWSISTWPLRVREPASQHLVNLLRETFANPFRRITFQTRWRSTTVESLARAIYDDRAFNRLPILADALEEAGCTHPDVLQHLRNGGEHVRGCWALDLVLGKK